MTPSPRLTACIRLTLVALAVTASGGCRAAFGPSAPVPAPPAPPPPRYRLIDLGANFSATDLNDRGQVVGNSSVSGAANKSSAKTVLWEGGKRREIFRLIGRTGGSHRINNSAQITTHVVPSYDQRVQVTPNTMFNWDEFAGVFDKGKVRNLGAPASAHYSAPRDINDAGVVVGAAGRIPGGLGERAVLWKPGSPGQDLGNLGSEPSEASAINKHGTVVGISAIRKGPLQQWPAFRAFLWSEGQMRDLGTLPGHKESKAIAINDHGDVVGVSGEMTGVLFHAFLWTGNRMQPLPSLSGHNQSYAHAINNHRQAVGYSYRREPDFNGAAVLWQNGAVYDLNRLITPVNGAVLRDAVAVNNRAEILAAGRLQGKGRSFLLRPEPTKVER